MAGRVSLEFILGSYRPRLDLCVRGVVKCCKGLHGIQGVRELTTLAYLYVLYTVYTVYTVYNMYVLRRLIP